MLDDPGALVPEHHRRRALPLALHLMEIGAADPHRGHADDHVVRAGLGEVELDDLEGLADCPKEPGSSLHPRILSLADGGRRMGGSHPGFRMLHYEL